MIQVSDEVFNQIVGQAIDDIPKKYYQRIKNVAFVIEDNPTAEQAKKIQLRSDHLLFGLYEGIPLTKRNSGYNLVLPDKITIFKEPISLVCNTLAELTAQVHKTVWHEVAHYFGLDHEQIHRLGA